jgi:MoaA/NifB/PqqE/SkfB family radical SAM enzyme
MKNSFSNKNIPVKTAHFELTNSCNLRCLMCPVNRIMKRKKEVMPFSVVKKIVDMNPGVETWGLNNWGESLLHPDFLKIVRYIKGKGKKVIFATNATLLSKRMSDRLAKLGPDEVLFSMEAVGKDYERIRGYPYEKVKRNILYFLSVVNRKKTHVQIPVTVFEKNEAKIGELKKEWGGLLRSQPNQSSRSKKTAEKESAVSFLIAT